MRDILWIPEGSWANVRSRELDLVRRRQVRIDVCEDGIEARPQRRKAGDDANADDGGDQPYSIAVAPDSSFTKREMMDLTKTPTQ